MRVDGCSGDFPYEHDFLFFSFLFFYLTLRRMCHALYYTVVLCMRVFYGGIRLKSQRIKIEVRKC